MAGWYVSLLNDKYTAKIILSPWGVINNNVNYNCSGAVSELKITTFKGQELTDTPTDSQEINNVDTMQTPVMEYLYCLYGVVNSEYERRLWRIVKEFLISQKLLNDLSRSEYLENSWPISIGTHKERINSLLKSVFVKARIDASMQDAEVLVILEGHPQLARDILNEIVNNTNSVIAKWQRSYWISRLVAERVKIKKTILVNYASTEKIPPGLFVEFEHDLKNNLIHYIQNQDSLSIKDIFTRFKQKIPKHTVGMNQLLKIDESLKLLSYDSLDKDVSQFKINLFKSGVMEVAIIRKDVFLVSFLAGLLAFFFMIFIISIRVLLSKKTLF